MTLGKFYTYYLSILPLSEILIGSFSSTCTSIKYSQYPLVDDNPNYILSLLLNFVFCSVRNEHSPLGLLFFFNRVGFRGLFFLK